MSGQKGTDISIQVNQRYPKEQFNSLVPMATVQEVSELYKPIMQVVQLDEGDIYQEGKGEDDEGQQRQTTTGRDAWAIAKSGLMKLMSAANIQVISTRSVDPDECQRCYRIAREFNKAPECYKCDNRANVGHEVTLAVPEASGQWRIVTASKYLNIKELEKTMKPKQFMKFLPHKKAMAETKAMLRALRTALSIKATYPKAQIMRPFVVVYYVLNMDVPEFKAALIDRVKGSSAALYGGAAMPQLGAGGQYQLPGAISSVQNVPDDGDDFSTDDEDFDADQERDLSENVSDYPDFVQEALREQDEPKPEIYECEACHAEIKGNDQKGWSAKTIAEWGKKNLGAQLCQKCQAAKIKFQRDTGGNSR